MRLFQGMKQYKHDQGRCLLFRLDAALPPLLQGPGGHVQLMGKDGTGQELGDGVDYVKVSLS